MICPACNADNVADTEECFGCGRAMFALTLGRLLADRYEIRRPIGQGGMGKVYEAFDRVLEERCAVKVLRPQFAREPDMAKRFLSEIRLARRITHPNVCRLHEYGESDGIRYLCMELVDGVNLKEVLRARRLGTEDAYDVALAASEGLSAVHAQGVIHRDFKTANIMIDRRGRVKVMDFGIAKEAGSDSTGISLAGHVMGTPEYMSPEHAQGGPIDFRSDLYALGCVIFEVFAGRALFQGSSPIDTLRRHLHQPLVFANDAGPLVPEPLVPVLTRALAKKADDRYPTVLDLIEDLRSARAESALFAVLGEEEPLASLLSILAPEPLPEPLPEPAPAPSRESRVASGAEGPGATRALTPAARPSGPRPAPPASWPAARLAGIGSAAVIVAVLAFVWLRRPEPAPSATEPPPSVANAPPATAVVVPAPALPSPSLEAVPATLLEARPTAVAPRVERQRPAAAPSAPPSPPPPASLAASPAPSPEPARVADMSVPSTPITTPESMVSAHSGVLKLLVLPPSEVRIDEKSLGIVSSRELRLPAGTYTLAVENTQYTYNRVVTIYAGIAIPLVIDLSEMGVRK